MAKRCPSVPKRSAPSTRTELGARGPHTAAEGPAVVGLAGSAKKHNSSRKRVPMKVCGMPVSEGGQDYNSWVCPCALLVQWGYHPTVVNPTKSPTTVGNSLARLNTARTPAKFCGGTQRSASSHLKYFHARPCSLELVVSPSREFLNCFDFMGKQVVSFLLLALDTR